jgi:hypothetical protein
MDTNEYKNNAKKWAIEKLGGKCSDCGIESKNQEIYDFHHKKRKNKSERVNAALWFRKGKIPLNIVLLCANCHRIRTARIKRHKLKNNLEMKPVLPAEFRWKFGAD